jgi:hypothetical protein
MRDHHGQDRPLAGAAAGGPADRGGALRPLDRGVGPGECIAYSWNRERERVVRYRWPCEQPDAVCAVDYFDLDALAGRCPGDDDVAAGVQRDAADRGDAVPDGDEHPAAVFYRAGEGGAAVPLRGGLRPDRHAGGDDGAGPDRGTVDIGDWPDLSGGW